MIQMADNLERKSWIDSRKMLEALSEIKNPTRTPSPVERCSLFMLFVSLYMFFFLLSMLL